MPKDLHTSSHSVFSVTFWGRQCYYLHFIDDWSETREANWQRELVNTESGVKPSVAWFQNLSFNYYAILSQAIIRMKQQITEHPQLTFIGYLLCAKHRAECWNKSGWDNYCNNPYLQCLNTKNYYCYGMSQCREVGRGVGVWWGTKTQIHVVIQRPKLLPAECSTCGLQSYHKMKERDDEKGTPAPNCLSPELTPPMGSQSRVMLSHMAHLDRRLLQNVPWLRPEGVKHSVSI